MSALASKHFCIDIEALYTEIFKHLSDKGKINNDNAELLSLEYTAPITMLIHLCDREPGKEAMAVSKIKGHIDHFISMYCN